MRLMRDRLLVSALAILLLVLVQGTALAAYSSPIVGKAYEETIYTDAAVECISVGTTGTLPPGIAVSLSGTGVGNQVIMSGTPTAEGTYTFTVTTQTNGGTDRTDDVSLTVLPCASTPVVSLAVSSSGTVPLGGSLTFTPTVIDANGALAYRWYRQDSSGTPQTIGTGTTLTFSPGTVVSSATMYLEVTNTLNGTSAVGSASANYTVTAAATLKPSPTPTSTPTTKPTISPTPTSSPTPAISESLIAGNKEGEIFNCNVAVNVRSGPGTGYEIIGSAALGQQYEALAKSGQWYKIQYSSRQIGYVHSNYFTLDSVSAVTQTPTPTVSPTSTPTVTSAPMPAVSNPPATTPALSGDIATASPTATLVPAVSASTGAAPNDAFLYILIGMLGMLVIVALITLVVLLSRQAKLRREEDETFDDHSEDDGYPLDPDSDEDEVEDEEDETDEDIPDLGFHK